MPQNSRKTQEEPPVILLDEASLIEDEAASAEEDTRPEAVLYHRSPNPTMVGQSQAVRLVTAIMQQGARYSDHTFGIHYLLLPRMHHAAYTLKDEKAFLALIEQYLTEAVGHIPQAARKEDIPILVGGLQLLIGELVTGGHDGLGLVARYILAAANSVVDRF